MSLLWFILDQIECERQIVLKRELNLMDNNHTSDGK